MNAMQQPSRPPFRIERVGHRFELVHSVGEDDYRYGVSHYHLYLLARDVLSAVGSIVLNTLGSGGVPVEAAEICAKCGCAHRACSRSDAQL